MPQESDIKIIGHWLEYGRKYAIIIEGEESGHVKGQVSYTFKTSCQPSGGTATISSNTSKIK